MIATISQLIVVVIAVWFLQVFSSKPRENAPFAKCHECESTFERASVCPECGASMPLEVHYWQRRSMREWLLAHLFDPLAAFQPRAPDRRDLEDP
ncbi:hypothetical protein D8S78_13285 [Natrialba swarupiae]|nr:hypothetical protein [Natrialba swarupiae]